MIYEVETIEKFIWADNTTRPKAPYDLLISIKGDINSSNTNAACEWKDYEGEVEIEIEFKKDGKIESFGWALCQSNTGGWVKFIFATYSQGTSDYVLVFPDGVRIPLGNLIDKNGGIDL